MTRHDHYLAHLEEIKASSRAWYWAHREVSLARAMARLEATVPILNAYYSQPCTDCGLVDPEIMQADHLPGTKTNGRNIGRYLGCSTETFRKELAKTEPVCPNCHARRTARRAGPPKTKRRSK